jgi:hypothetical protein
MDQPNQMHVMFDGAPTEREYDGRKWQTQTAGLYFPGQRMPLLFQASLEIGQEPYRTDVAYGLTREHFSVDRNALKLNGRAAFVPLTSGKLSQKAA